LELYQRATLFEKPLMEAEERGFEAVELDGKPE